MVNTIDEGIYDSKVSEDRVNQIKKRLKGVPKSYTQSVYYEGDMIYIPDKDLLYREMTDRVIEGEGILIEVYHHGDAKDLPTKLKYCREITESIDEYKIIDKDEEMTIQIKEVKEDGDTYRQIIVEYRSKHIPKIEKVFELLKK